MRFLVSTVRRHCPPDEHSGYIYLLDHSRKKILQRSEMVEPWYRELDTNPRGGMRGAKGISVCPSQNYVALSNFSMIFLYDSSWKLLKAITHPLCAGVHDIAFRENALWVTAARTDLLLKFDLEGNLLRHFYLRAFSEITTALKWSAPILLDEETIDHNKVDFRHPLQVEKEEYDRAHVNSLCFLNNGDILISMGFIFDERFANLLRLKKSLISWGFWKRVRRINNWLSHALRVKQKNVDQQLVVKPARAKSAIVRLTPDNRGKVILILENVTAPSHSLLNLWDERVIYLNTSEGEIINFEPERGGILSKVRITNQGFLRGVTTLNKDTILVGNCGEIITFDLKTNKAIESWLISQDPHEAIFDIKPCPSHFSILPQSLADELAALNRGARFKGIDT